MQGLLSLESGGQGDGNDAKSCVRMDNNGKPFRGECAGWIGGAVGGGRGAAVGGDGETSSRDAQTISPTVAPQS